jgi:hypothetical protein
MPITEQNDNKIIINDNIVNENLIYYIVQDNADYPKATLYGKHIIENYENDNWIDIINTSDNKLFINGSYYKIYAKINVNDDYTKVWEQSCFNAEADNTTLNDLISENEPNTNIEGDDNMVNVDILQQELEKKREEIQELKDEKTELLRKIDKIKEDKEKERIQLSNEILRYKQEIDSVNLHLENEKWRNEQEKKIDAKPNGLSGLDATTIIQGLSIVNDLIRTFKGQNSTGTPSFTAPVSSDLKEEDINYSNTEEI